MRKRIYCPHYDSDKHRHYGYHMNNKLDNNTYDTHMYLLICYKVKDNCIIHCKKKTIFG